MKSLGRRPEGARLERLKASPRFDGERFRNLHPIPPGLRDPNASLSISDFLCGGEHRVPKGPLPALDPIAAWRTAPASRLRATWLGHSTVLLEFGARRVLTDPVWGSRASPLRIAGPRRFQPVPVALRAMPPLDVPFVTSLGVGAHLEAWGVRPGRITSSTGGNRTRCRAPESP
jgi:hypothetical protein